MAKRVILGFVCAVVAVTLHAATFTVVNTSDSGAGSLRQAILDSNANGAGTTDVIEFNIAGLGPHLIAPASVLPTIITPVTIDGYTQPGSSPNSMPLPSGNNAVLMIGMTCGQSFTGIDIDAAATGTTIRGLEIAACVFGINSAAQNTTIAGNFIGNNGGGVVLTAASNSTVGGAAVSDRNVISGNEAYAIVLSGGDDITIQDNYVGTAPTGLTSMSNGDAGILVIGATRATIDHNLVSGNDDQPETAGIILLGECIDTAITRNLIGTDRTGTTAVPNAYGIRLETLMLGLLSFAPEGTTIGGPSGAHNIIQFNSARGVSLPEPANPLGSGAEGTTIRYNTFDSNSILGIDLGNDGPTANDALDEDDGPNHLQNFPVLLTRDQAPDGTVTVSGTLDSAGSQSYTIDIYFASQCHPSQYGEGTWAAATTVTTDINGSGSFNVVTPALPIGTFISATATDASGNTSEFSLCGPVAAVAAQSMFSVDSAAVTEGNAGTTNVIFTVTLSPAAPDTTQVQIATSNGTAQSGVDFTSTMQTLTFLPGETTKQFFVPVIGDVAIEADETFTVTLSNAVNATIGTGHGTGTIVNDDVAMANVPIPSLNALGLAAITSLLLGIALLRLRS